MNLLIEDAPRTLCGQPINTDFRAMVQLELLIRDPEVEAVDKIPLGLRLLFPDGLGQLSTEEAWEALLWYYGGGGDKEHADKEKPKKEPNSPPKRARRVYDFEQDSDHIYAAFRQVYGVDLQQVPLHWWEFRAMLFALPDTCLQGRIMAYRATDVSKLKGAEKKRMVALQRQFAIKDVSLSESLSAAQRDEKLLQQVAARFEEAKKWQAKQKAAAR